MAAERELPYAAALEVPLGHAARVRGLWSAARAGRLAHALVFAGPQGIGKFRAALWCSAGLLCARGLPSAAGAPCGECGPCKRLASGNHPDLYVVDVRQEESSKRSEELRIGRFVSRDEPYWQAPTVDDFLALRPAEGGWRIVVVREMERANVEAQNAILKSLEEPAPSVLWILETSTPGALLATIRSRCIRTDFEPLSTAQVGEVLRAHDVPAAVAQALARWSRGSPGLALQRYAQGAFQMRALLLEVLAGRTAPTLTALALWKLEGEFEGKTPKAVERARLRAVLDLALELLRDVVRGRAGVAPAELAHTDVLGAVGDYPVLNSDIGAERALECLLGLRRDVEANIDPPLLLERALRAMAPPRPARAAGGR